MLDDAERLRRIAAWSRAYAAWLAPIARPPKAGERHRFRVSAADLDGLLDGLERIEPELDALAARLDAARAGGRPRLRAVATTE